MGWFRLPANQIPLAGRIVALADVFDALTSERPYKKAFPIEKTNQISTRGSGQHFDPGVVKAFFTIQDEILHFREIHQDEKQNTMFCFDHMLNEGSFSSIADCIAM
jgi:putative two-component system response regulator